MYILHVGSLGFSAQPSEIIVQVLFSLANSAVLNIF